MLYAKHNIQSVFKIASNTLSQNQTKKTLLQRNKKETNNP
ncbi:hypothetical protein EDF67_10320 [Sphingobacterium sp. JUb78]|nr:hypothetical protein [Sphingobacterium sp. JUb21]MCW2263411.1 hypothetical protein [Sphingobacterium kitahiroshimense]TCR08164.1 hypothetical protein EDF66_104269 [Sphingobacterium sp. JUb20]TCR11607.1 hypothetical protein EDF67_10320 [Sphingobacterium sp. JUb78]